MHTVFADDITADVLTYNGKTKVVTADGNVIINGNDGATIKGEHGAYHFIDRSAWIAGNVSYSKASTRITAERLELYSDKTIQGIGNVVYHDGAMNRTLRGDAVSYNTESGDSNIQGNGYLSTSEGEVRAPHIWGNLKEIQIRGEGGVHIHSEVNQITAYGDTAIYTKTPNQNNGVLYLRGNATAHQRGNSFSGPELVLKDEEQIVETNGRSTLVITNSEGF